MYVVGYPKSGNTWLCFLIAYCLNAEYDDCDQPGIHPRNEYQRQYVKGGLAHPSYQQQVGKIIKTHKIDIPDGDNRPLVYLIRDGRDVMVSYYFYRHTYINSYSLQNPKNWLRKIRSWTKSTLKQEDIDLSSFLVKYTSNWVNHVQTWLDRNPTAIVRYEDLKTNPEATLTQLFQQLGVAVAPEIWQQALTIFDFKQLAQRQAGEEDRSSFFRKGIVGDWQNYFTADDIEFFRAEAGDILTRTGYKI